MPHPNFSQRLITVRVLACALALGTNAYAARGKTIHNFQSLQNGANPQSTLITDSAGNLYGTTYIGGAHNLGEVYEMVRNSNGSFTQTTIYSFAGPLQNDGSYPWSALTFDSAGNLYGTTAGGGTSTACAGGCGTVYKLSPKAGGGWTEAVLFILPGGSGGAFPIAGVALDSAGNVYSAAQYNGQYSGYGMVFKLAPGSPWTETVLYTFTGGADGGYPTTTPVFDTAGNLYGTTLSNSSSYGGVVYELSQGSSGWTEKVIHTFNIYPIDGGQPEGGLIFDAAGNLYGTASHGGTCGSSGTVFELTPSAGGTWTEKQLYCFGQSGSYTDGAIPEGTIAFDSSGNLYGTTFEGGSAGYGTVYQLTPTSSGSWKEHIIKNFKNGADGATPVGGVAFDSSGYLYATAYDGNSQACLYGNYGTPGCGTVIQMTPNGSGAWPSVTISHFSSTDAATPMGGLIADSGGNYYGTASAGGKYGSGEVFKLSQSNGTWHKTVLYDFTGTNGDGIFPSGNLLFDKAGNLYGTTQFGGSSDYCSNYAGGCGIVFELTPNASGPWKEKILYTFPGENGGQPVSGLIFDKAGNLYGTTLQGGLNYCDFGACGMVYELSPGPGGTWTEKTLYQFTGGNDGGSPYGGVVMDSAGNLFGTTFDGGTIYLGVAFELSPASGGTWTFNVIYTFGLVTGDPYYPLSGFVMDSSGNLYGTAYGPTGSFTNAGTVYKLSQSGGVWSSTVLYGFTAAPDGSAPYGGVTFDSAGNLYGTTWYGGTSTVCRWGCGTIFKLTANGSSGYTESVMYSFSGEGDGAVPVSSVWVDASGNVFTTTSSGGGGHQGTAFEVMP
jgi:uncharacterized repeat protein (TIGR03803 family)